MDVKQGYKQTEVGMIPEDWDVHSLGDIGESLIGLTYSPSDVRTDGVLVLRSSNIQDDKLRFDDNVFVSTAIPDRIMVRDGDILICVRNGSRELIGKSVRLDERAHGMTFGAFMAVFRSPYSAIASHQFQSAVIKRQIHEHLGATINQITNKSLNSFRIPLPPTRAEQDAIAEALSDANALIEALEQLLAKKRHLKKGTMQELFTGKKRLPGFSEEWAVKRLRDICHMKSGEGITSENIDAYSEFPCYGGNGLRGFSKRYTHEGSYALIGRQGALCGNVLTVGGKFFASEHAIVVAPLNGTDIRWLALALVRMNLNQYSESSAQPGLSVSKLLSFSVKVPPSDEQTAIAAILSDMDAEISALETKLAKARQVKQGMMQELLIGRIRFV